MALPRDPRVLAAALPDEPRWVETRWLLRSGEGKLRLGRGGDAAVVIGRSRPTGAVVGRVDPELLRAVSAGAPVDFELIVQMEALTEARQALPDWEVTLAAIHSPARPVAAQRTAEPGVVVSSPPERRWLEQLPRAVRRYVEQAGDIAVRVVDGRVVAVCEAGVVTETLWDVGIDTLEGHRRRGHAAACFCSLAAHMAAQGRQPVWGAAENNVASMRLAEKLGFERLDRLAVLARPA